LPIINQISASLSSKSSIHNVWGDSDDNECDIENDLFNLYAKRYNKIDLS
jgi:hypothetical protein